MEDKRPTSIVKKRLLSLIFSHKSALRESLWRKTTHVEGSTLRTCHDTINRDGERLAIVGRRYSGKADGGGGGITWGGGEFEQVRYGSDRGDN